MCLSTDYKTKQSLNFIHECVDTQNIAANPQNSYDNMRRAKDAVINKRMKGRDGDEGMIDVWHIDKRLTKSGNTILSKTKDYCLAACENAFNVNYNFFTTNMYYNKLYYNKPQYNEIHCTQTHYNEIH